MKTNKTLDEIIFEQFEGIVDQRPTSQKGKKSKKKYDFKRDMIKIVTQTLTYNKVYFTQHSDMQQLEYFTRQA